MKDFNVGRWLLGGVLAGLVIWVLEGALSGLYVAEMTARMNELGLSMDMSLPHVVGSIASTILGGLVMVFFYALLRAPLARDPTRPRSSRLPCSVAATCRASSVTTCWGCSLRRYLFHWGAQGLVEMIVASVVGASIYKPRAAAPGEPVT
ncbi:MAG: hypothetical protein U5K76_07955 [Woeseiaceae bacterium]|nr:hypothetical protein [Woeseiaceae bacterium]